MRAPSFEAGLEGLPYKELSEDALLAFMFARALREARGPEVPAVFLGESFSLLRRVVRSAGLPTLEYHALTESRVRSAALVLVSHTLCINADQLGGMKRLHDALVMLHGYLRHLNTCHNAFQALRDAGACVAVIPVGPGFLVAVLDDVGSKFISNVTSAYLTSLREGPMPVSFNTAKLLYILAGSLGGLIVEVGTGRGFSTAWLAAGARRSGGKVFSFEAKEERVREARSLLEELGFLGVAEVISGDFRESVHSIAGQKASLIFIDGAKEEYLDYLRALESAGVVGEGTLILAHNTVSHIKTISPYVEAVYSGGYLSLTTMTDRAGLTITLVLNTTKSR